MMPLIMLVGNAGVGKDTVAGMMAEMGGMCIAQADPLKAFARDVMGFTNEQLYGPSEMRNKVDPRPRTDFISDWYDYDLNKTKMKWLNTVASEMRIDELNHWFNIHVHGAKEEPITPRRILQTLGTEFGRAINPNIWANHAQKRARKLLEATDRKGTFVVITDGRFANEVLATKKRGGLVVKISSPADVKASLKGSAGQHKSETELEGIPSSWFDYEIINDKTMGLGRLCESVKRVLEDSVLLEPKRVW